VTISRTEWLRELWHYRELLYFLAWRDVTIRYKQAALGAAWAILQPLMGMIIFTLFFGRLARMPSGDIPYPIFVYAGLAPWTYFANVLNTAGNSLVGNSNLVTKVYFPRVLLPGASAAAGLLDLGISSTVLLLLMAYYGITPGWTVLWLPILLVGLVLVSVGVSMLFAALNVRYRDIKHAMPFLIQMWLFCTPIVYPSTLVPEQFRPILALNPCWGLIDGIRSSLLAGHSFDAVAAGTSFLSAMALFVVGLLYFRSAERTFADVI
jgi:lipopolysaccharide transport system permease protein